MERAGKCSLPPPPDPCVFTRVDPAAFSAQLKISFSETALETTYQYPSESSVLEELGPEPEAPSAPTAAPVDDEEDEEELLLLQPGLRTKALIVGKWTFLQPERAPWIWNRHHEPAGDLGIYMLRLDWASLLVTQLGNPRF